MKILYSTRLFSGLESSFTKLIWEPSGVPTIHRIIQEIDSRYDVNFVFSAKDSGNEIFSIWKESNDQTVSISGLNNKVKILAGIDFFPVWFGRKPRILMREIRQLYLVVRECYKFKPDIIYCDHANIFVAAFLSRFQSRVQVVLRVMGAYPSMKEALVLNKLRHVIYRWAYRSPFSLVICTQDGSGVEPWLKNALSINVKVVTMLNGVDMILKSDDSYNLYLNNLPKNRIKILYVGKLEKYKGCYEFVHAILNLLNVGKDIHAIIVGVGNEEEQLRNDINKNNALDSFTFIKNLPNKEIHFLHNICDIYVSMNHLGNLSNSNLEAIQSNDCMIFPCPQPEHGIDVITKSYLGDSVMYVPFDNSDKLSESLNILINSKDLRMKMSEKVSHIKDKFLYSWEERVNKEITLLESLLKS